MSNTTETKAPPTYRIYSVHKTGEKKPVWQEILQGFVRLLE